MSPAKVRGILRKAHAQLGFPASGRFVRFLKTAGLSDGICSVGASVAEESPVRRKMIAPPPKPVVSMPRASSFNEAVRLDLAFIDGKPVMHAVCVHTRFTVAEALESMA